MSCDYGGYHCLVKGLRGMVKILKVSAVAMMLFVPPALADRHITSYEFDTCLGHETICEDEFNEVIHLIADDSGVIATDIQFNHPHISKISQGRMRRDGDRFISAHNIINNLGYNFTVTIIGRAKTALAEEALISLGEEELASLTLQEITPLTDANTRNAK